MCLRETRSASEPASGPTASAGANAMNAVNPTQVVECVSWKTTNGTVMVCIQLPVFEMIAADQNSA